MKSKFDGGKITITITKRDLKEIIENKNRANSYKIINMDKLMKNLAYKLIEPFFEDQDGMYCVIEKSIEDIAQELIEGGADYLEFFD